MGDENQNNDGKKDESGKPDLAAQNSELTKKIAELDKKIAEYSKKPDPKDDPDLLDKAKKDREQKDKRSNDTKALEKALTFNLKSEDFLKTNESLLPKDIKDIFSIAQKETYNDAIEKDGAIKAGIIQSFFSVQENVDLLTPSVKSSLDDYLKLTKTGKQEKAQAIYDNIFEPTFEMKKRIKRAEALQKGFGNEGDAETAYKNKLIAGSKKHFGIGS